MADKEKKDIVIAENRSFEGVWIPKKLYITGKFNLRTKFFVVEIKSLSKHGYCFATDRHFAEFLGVSERTVQTMIKQLKDNGYLTAEYEYEKDTQAIKRRFLILTQKFYDEFYNEEEIKLSKESSATPPEENFDRGIEENFDRGIEENCGEKYNINSSIPKSSETDKYAFSKDKSFENVDDIYASRPDGQESAPAKPNRYIPPDYSYEQLEEHIKPVYTERLKTVYGCDDTDMPLTELLEITLEFYKLYECETGERHRVLSDKGYENIVDSFMNPPDIMLCDTAYAFDVDCYMEMAELYFKTDYNRLGKYKGTVQKSLSHFMSSAVRENLFMREQI